MEDGNAYRGVPQEPREVTTMGMFDEVLCNHELFGKHKGEVCQTKSLQPFIGGALENYEITPAGRLEFLEYRIEVSGVNL